MFPSSSFSGCIKFLEPYYLILVRKRRRIGTICGHPIYSIEESQTITVPHVSVQSDAAHSKTELRWNPLTFLYDLCQFVLGLDCLVFSFYADTRNFYPASISRKISSIVTITLLWEVYRKTSPTQAQQACLMKICLYGIFHSRKQFNHDARIQYGQFLCFMDSSSR